jgi:cyclic-di-AMP phosphodiesterase PgpH
MAKSGKSRTGTSGSIRRRADLRRTLPKPTFDLASLFERPEVTRLLLIVAAFLLVTSAIVVWSREQVLVADGQIMTETRLKRIDYTVVDELATEQKRAEARREAPRIYRPNRSHLNRLEAAISGLPKAAAGRTSLDEMSQELVQEFELTEAVLTALQEHVDEGEPTRQWQRWTARLLDEQFLRRPLLTSQEFQVYITTLNRALMTETDASPRLLDGQPIELRSEARDELKPRLRDLVQAAGFPADVAPAIAARLLFDPQPTLVYDAEETERQQYAAAAAVSPVVVEHRYGEVLYRRGDLLQPAQLREVEIERERFMARATARERWLPRFGVAGVVLLLVSFFAVHVATTYPKITRNVLRVASLCVLMAGMITLTALITRQSPNLIYAAAIGPTLIVAMIVLLAYDLRLAIFVSALQSVLVVLTIDKGAGWFVLLMTACGTMILQLRDVRHRNSLIRAAVVTAVVVAVGSILLGLYRVPLVPGATAAILMNAAWGGLATVAVGFLMLGVLPSIERAFDITTGMTLAELRDPKQPLLRQLQQKAPGTYNHSLQVANVAEAAADAIGADSLLVYVGALYHDIGKMNKPEYFIENQAGGVNKHDKLSPAMSLLVIVGHVKDGIELAREYGLPRSLQHFIESHHGTTLVEYFYHAARSQAEARSAERADRTTVEEVEFRYPGPKPQTKEAAILMLSDAVESATRAMADPNPARIENIVREMAHKRLMDNQFDQCDLTFRELALIEDAIISRLCAIHHGRISYPKGAKPVPSADDEAADTVRSVSA